MAELADALDSGSSSFTGVGVQIPPSAPKNMITNEESFLKYLSSKKTPVDIHALRRHFDIKKNDRSRFKKFIDTLLKEGSVIRLKDDLFGLPAKMNLVTGKMLGNPAGFGFVRQEDKEDEDIYVHGNNMNGAMHGDKVIVRMSRGPRGNEGEVVRVLEHANATVVGTFEENKFFGFVVPDEKKIWHHIYIPKELSLGIKGGQKAVVEVTEWPGRGRNPEGRIIEILGYKNDPEVDVKAVIRQYGLPEIFSPEALEQAEESAVQIPEEEYRGREDLRNETIFTIDGEDAKDFDDAVSIKRKSNGEYDLGVHIADVSHYVKEGTALDKEAFIRGNSVYLPGTVIPMLPEALSNEMCSLKPDVDRLAVSVSMRIGIDGSVKSHKIFRSVIRSKHRMTYTKVSAIVEAKDAALRSEYKDITGDLDMMLVLARLLNDRRYADGSIDFNFPESKVIVDEKDVPLRVIRVERNWAHRLIEEFMLLTNEVVSLHIFRKGMKNIYRIHEVPEFEDITELAGFVNKLGYAFKPPEDLPPKAIQALLAKVKGTPEEAIVNKLALRSLKLAIYSTEAKGHFALAKKFYSHFTSPIRRYPDLAVHRLIKNAINGEKVDVNRLGNIAKHCSETERKAERAEEDVVKIKKIQLIRNFPAKAYAGVISGVQGYGMFVEINDFMLEGLVHISSIGDDYYAFDEKNWCLTGRNKRKKYRLGDPVKVKVIKADLDKRQLDLALV